MTFSQTIALVGRPNCGKTTLFNALTGEHQWVGNWPGVTVEGVQGRFERKGREVTVVDLPGAYTLTGTRSLDEEVTAEYLAGNSCAAVINVVDASQLERSLYLTLQVLESQGRIGHDGQLAVGLAGRPVVVALNRMDKAVADGVAIDVAGLAETLGCPVVPMSSKTGDGVIELQDAVLGALAGKVAQPPFPPYPDAVVNGLRQRALEWGGDRPGARWTAIRALEDLEDDAAEGLALAAARHAQAQAVAEKVVRRQERRGRSATDRLDAVVLHPLWGVVAFLAVMYVMFLWTIQVGGAFIDVFDGLALAVFEKGLVQVLDGAGAPAWFSLIAEGAGRGIRTVAAFIPLVGFLYAFLAVLEESGYMSRAAVVMDRFMRRLGLPGKAFVPLVVGLGCNVPAVMAARTLEDASDRKAVIAMTPFMSCGARLPVYALFAATFFPTNGENVVFALYLAGIAVAVLTGFVLKRTLFGGKVPPLLIELADYQRPSVVAVLSRAWERVCSFTRDAGIIVVPVVVVLTMLNAVTLDGRIIRGGPAPDTILATAAKVATPVLAPIGIAEDNWEATIGLFTGVFAKEALVGTLRALYSAEPDASAPAEAEPTVPERLAAAFATVPANLGRLASALTDPLGLGQKGIGAANTDEGTAQAMTSRFDGAAGAFAYLVFVLLYAPCIATIGAIRREAGGRWTVFVLLWTVAMGFAAGTLTYQLATLTRHPLPSLAWIGAALAGFGIAVAFLRRLGHTLRPIEGAAPVCGGACSACSQNGRH